LDIAPRYAAILMGFSNGIGTLAGLTCPFVTEKFIARGAHGWEKVFLLSSLIHFTGVTFYAVFASGELQDWAEPKDEEEPWNAKTLKTKESKIGGYGAAGDSIQQVRIEPLPSVDQLRNDRIAQGQYQNMAPYGDGNSNEGTEPTTIINHNYQGY
uniref:Probable vesicular glutamate transporter eat-4 (inferred by orthology to a C. elegans protein) n=2 Tax=Anisakis simplex TaxID=6269 RepID=A0A0M3J5N6_ANISI